MQRIVDHSTTKHVARYQHTSRTNVITAATPPRTQAICNPIDPSYLTTTYARNATTGVLNSETHKLRGATPSADQNVVTQYAYSDATNPGLATSVIDPKSKTWTFHYTVAGDLDYTLAPAVGGVQPKTLYVYDAIGRRTAMLSPEGNKPGNNYLKYLWIYSYVPSGEIYQEQQPYLGKITTYGYDSSRNLVGTTNPDGNTIAYIYNAAGEQTSTQRGSAPAWVSDYDGFGNLSSQTDGSGKTTAYAYDSEDHLVGTTDPLGRTTSASYDAAGRRLSEQEPAGNCGAVPKTGCTTFGYSNADELTSINYNDGGATGNVTYTYDGVGRRKAMTDGTGTTSYTYDTLDRLTGTAAPAAQTVGYGYDLNGQVTGLSYPGAGKTVTRTYDDAGRLSSVQDWLSPSHTTSFSYNLDGALTGIQYPNNVSETYAPERSKRESCGYS